MNDSIAAAMKSEMLTTIREIVALGVRRPGSPANLATEQYLHGKLQSFGLTCCRFEPVPVQFWAPTKTAVVFTDDAWRVDAFPTPYTAWTTGTGVEAPAVFLGRGNLADFDAVDVNGKVAVVELKFGELSTAALKAGAHFVHDPDGTIPDGPLHVATWLIENFSAYYEAHRRGAAAFIGILANSPVDGGEQYVPYDGFLKDLPSAWVGRESAAEVTARAKRGDLVRFLSTGRTTEVESHNVIGVVPGDSDESIILSCHHDAPFASAVEDASGLAVLLWLARAFQARKTRLKRNLVFVASSGHFHGGIGNRVFVETHRDGLLRKTVAALGIEHIAEEAEADGAGGYRLTGRPEVRVLFVDKNPCLIELLHEGVKRYGLDRIMAVDSYLFGPEPPCDTAPFFTAGVPSVCHISGPLYLFDPYDTIDKVRAEDLPRVASMFRELVERIDAKPAAELEVGLTRRRNDPPPAPAPWFLPPSAYPRPT